MVKIAVIEDSEKWRRIIKGFLEAYAKENKSDYLVEIFSDGNSFLCRDSQGYDLVFMDIDLPGASGLEVSRDLRKSNTNVCLVFFTELAQFAVQGYEVNAFDYLVKPFTYSLFCLKMNRFLSHISASNERSFVLKDGKSTQRIRYDDILYFESQKHYLFFHLSDCMVKKYRASLEDVQDGFLQHGFSKINRSIIVNLSKIDDFSNNDIRIGKEILPLSRVYRTSFVASLNNFLGRGG